MKHRQGRQQRGAVAIMLGLMIFVLFGFMALAIDLGRTYVVRTELQNAADAAALAGAQQLDQTAAGVTKAVTQAIAIAAQNSYKFYSTVTLTSANIKIGSCPADGTCTMVAASSITTDALAAGQTFLQVDTASGALATFFAMVPTTSNGAGIASTSTFGQAVAGPIATQIMPMGVCAIDEKTPGGILTSNGLNELTEFGFRRGIAYDLASMTSVLGNKGKGYAYGKSKNTTATVSGPIWINPLVASTGTCDSSKPSENAMQYYGCNGTSMVITSLPTTALPKSVFVNTAVTATQMESALNSRFDSYTNNACDASIAPPDTNIKSYAVPTGASAGSPGNPRDWTEPGANTYPVNQSISLDPATSQPITSPTIGQYGALWSYGSAVKAAGSKNNATASTAFTLGDWSNLYAGNTADTTSTGYPSTAMTAPYNMKSGNYFQAPTSAHPGQSNRRVINVMLLNCKNVTSMASCTAISVVGIGKFFMPTPADLTGSKNAILNAEFAGLLTTLPTFAVRLYK